MISSNTTTNHHTDMVRHVENKIYSNLSKSSLTLTCGIKDIDLESGTLSGGVSHTNHDMKHVPPISEFGSNIPCTVLATSAFYAILNKIDYCGTKLANFFGLTDSRYAEFYDEQVYQAQLEQKFLVKNSLASSQSQPVNKSGALDQPNAIAYPELPI